MLLYWKYLNHIRQRSSSTISDVSPVRNTRVTLLISDSLERTLVYWTTMINHRLLNRSVLWRHQQTSFTSLVCRTGWGMLNLTWLPTNRPFNPATGHQICFSVFTVNSRHSLASDELSWPSIPKSLTSKHQDCRSTKSLTLLLRQEQTNLRYLKLSTILSFLAV